jgi:hypothetical protein
MNTFVLENLTARDLPPVWIKKFCPPQGQCITVQITFEEISDFPLITKKVSLQKERIALMREMEKQLSGTGDEDSEEWIKTIKETRTFSEPKHLF